MMKLTIAFFLVLQSQACAGATTNDELLQVDLLQSQVSIEKIEPHLLEFQTTFIRASLSGAQAEKNCTGSSRPDQRMLKSYSFDNDVDLGEEGKLHLKGKITFTSYQDYPENDATYVYYDLEGEVSSGPSKSAFDLRDQSLVFTKANPLGSNIADFVGPNDVHMQVTWCSDQGKLAAYTVQLIGAGISKKTFDIQEVGSDSTAADSAAADSDATDSAATDSDATDSTTVADPTATPDSTAAADSTNAADSTTIADSTTATDSTTAADSTTVDSAAADSTTAAIKNIKPHLPEFAEPLNFDIRACAAEGLAMMLFVIIGCGTAMSVAKESGWLLQVSLAFGLAITSLAYTVGNYSGGQINSAVTIGLVVMGHTSVMQGIGNIVFQVLGSIAGALFLVGMYQGEDADKTGGLGTNAVQEKYSKLGAFLGEFAMTFLLMFVVLQTAVNPSTSDNRVNACLAIGFAVFLAHCVLIPIDGCSINPPRTLGPALVSKIFYRGKEYESLAPFSDMWIFILAPTLGACAASGVYTLFLL